MTKPITKKVKGLRQRKLARGWRFWWEPNAKERAAGFEVFELDPARPSWSIRKCEDLNRATRDALVSTGKVRPTRGTRDIGQLITAYKKGRRWQDLSTASHRDYLADFRLITRKWGHSPVRDFTKPIMHAWYETLLGTTGKSQAKSMITKMSLLFSHAELIGWRPENSNPCSRLGMTTPPPRQRTASWSEIFALMDAAKELNYPTIAAIIQCMILTGQRPGNVIEAKIADFHLVDVPIPGAGPDQPQNRKAWIWQFIRTKRKNLATIELHPNLVPVISELLMRADNDQEHLFKDDLTGQPFSYSVFNSRWKKTRKLTAEKLPDILTLQVRDFRTTSSTLAREGGASISDAGDLLGNKAASNPLLKATYMVPDFESIRRAVRAIQVPSDGSNLDGKKKA